MQNQNNLVSVDSSSDFIEHFGIKGMKWGFRKQRISKVKARRRAKNSAKTSAKWKKNIRTGHRCLIKIFVKQLNGCG